MGRTICLCAKRLKATTLKSKFVKKNRSVNFKKQAIRFRLFMAQDKVTQDFLDDMWKKNELQRFRSMRRVTMIKQKRSLIKNLGVKEKVPVRRHKETFLLQSAAF